MSTLADELLNDFEDSGSEHEEEQNGGLFPDAEDVKSSFLNGNAPKPLNSAGMELDADEEEVDEDEEMAGMDRNAVEIVEDEEEAKAKVEKMQLGGVDDVRTVAGLMKTLEPVLEVSNFIVSHLSSHKSLGLHLFFCALALTPSPLSRKSHTSNHYHLRNRPNSLDPSKTIRNTTF